MNHSLFIELSKLDIEKQDAIELIHKGKIVMVTKECDKTIITLKGNGWRAWLRIDFREDNEVDIIDIEKLELSEYVELPRNAIVTNVKAECNEEIEECRIEYKYINIIYSVSMIIVVDINEYQKTDEIVYKFIAKYLSTNSFLYLVRPM